MEVGSEIKCDAYVSFRIQIAVVFITSNLIDEVLEESLELVNHSMQSHVQNKESLLRFLAVQAIWLKV